MEMRIKDPTRDKTRILIKLVDEEEELLDDSDVVVCVGDGVAGDVSVGVADGDGGEEIPAAILLIRSTSKLKC